MPLRFKSCLHVKLFKRLGVDYSARSSATSCCSAVVEPHIRSLSVQCPARYGVLSRRPNCLERSHEANTATAKDRIRTEGVLDQFPDHQKRMAQVADAIDKGIDAGIPGIKSIQLDTSLGPIQLASVSLKVVFLYQDKEVPRTLSADLSSVDRTINALASSFAEP